MYICVTCECCAHVYAVCACAVCVQYMLHITRVLSSVYTKRFEDFVQTVVAVSRGGGSVQFEYDAVSGG